MELGENNLSLNYCFSQSSTMFLCILWRELNVLLKVQVVLKMLGYKLNAHQPPRTSLRFCPFGIYTKVSLL